MTQRTIVIGDIHGCLEEFEELLRTIEFKQCTDRLVLLGDLVDRGPDPVGVVRRARELGAESVLGNHEERHLRFRRHEAKKYTNPSYKNPMKPFVGERLVEHHAYSAEDFAWMAALPITIRLPGNWIAVHAGFEAAYPLEKQRPEKMLRVRYVDATGKMKAISSDTEKPEGTVQWATVYREPVHVVYGHMALSMEKPVFTSVALPRAPETWRDENLREAPLSLSAPEGLSLSILHAEDRRVLAEIGATLSLLAPDETWLRCALDTACCFGGSLSALILPDRGEPTTASVKSKATYAQVWAGDD
jgi:hypothetical protein